MLHICATHFVWNACSESSAHAPTSFTANHGRQSASILRVHAILVKATCGSNLYVCAVKSGCHLLLGRGFPVVSVQHVVLRSYASTCAL